MYPFFTLMTYISEKCKTSTNSRQASTRSMTLQCTVFILSCGQRETWAQKLQLLLLIENTRGCCFEAQQRTIVQNLLSYKETANIKLVHFMYAFCYELKFTFFTEVQIILSILHFCTLYNSFSKIDGDFTFKFTNLQKQIII